MKYPDFFEENIRAIEQALEKLLPPASTAPPSIHEAMRYSVFAGGKRLRPMLCLEASRIFSTDPPQRFHAGARSNSFTPIR